MPNFKNSVDRFFVLCGFVMLVRSSAIRDALDVWSISSLVPDPQERQRIMGLPANERGHTATTQGEASDPTPEMVERFNVVKRRMNICKWIGLVSAMCLLAAASATGVYASKAHGFPEPWTAWAAFIMAGLIIALVGTRVPSAMHKALGTSPDHSAGVCETA